MASTFETDLSQNIVDDPALNNISAINVRRTCLLINDFIAHSADFMNKFANLAEQKLERVEVNMQKLEILTNLLEAKLEAIQLDGDDSTTPATSNQTQQQSTTTTTQSETDLSAYVNQPAPPPPQNSSATGAIPTPPNIWNNTDDSGLPPPPPRS
eukprot:UN00386